MRFTLITERRRHAPRGREGGGDGEPGRNLLNGEPLPSKAEGELRPGDRLRIETPGGGGWGSRVASRVRPLGVGSRSDSRSASRRSPTRTAATGPAVLFVHGLGGSAYAWWAQLAACEAGGYRAIAYDQRGAGRSSKPAGPYSVEQWAEDLVGLLDALGIERAALVGHSVGCMVAEHAALRLGERVRGRWRCAGARSVARGRGAGVRGARAAGPRGPHGRDRRGGRADGAQPSAAGRAPGAARPDAAS